MILKPSKFAKLERGHRLSRGLVGCWLMNEGGGKIVNDLSGNGNKINSFSGNTCFSAGKFGNCLKFDGTGDWAKIANCELLKLSTYNFTISLWTYVTSTTHQMFLFHGLGGVAWASYLFSIGGNENKDADTKYYFGFGNGVSATYANVSSVNAALTNQWAHLVAVYTGAVLSGTLLLYKNGLLDNSNSSNVYSKPGNISQDLWLGADSYTGGRFCLDGGLDNIQIWNRALSAPEIAQLYREPFAMFEEDM